MLFEVWSLLAGVLVGELIGLLPPRAHDWRLFVTPAELERAFAAVGFRAARFEAFDASPRMLLALFRLAFGLEPGTSEFHTGPLNRFLSLNYIGSAVAP